MKHHEVEAVKPGVHVDMKYFIIIVFPDDSELQ